MLDKFTMSAAAPAPAGVSARADDAQMADSTPLRSVTTEPGGNLQRVKTTPATAKRLSSTSALSLAERWRCVAPLFGGPVERVVQRH